MLPPPCDSAQWQGAGPAVPLGLAAMICGCKRENGPSMARSAARTSPTPTTWYGTTTRTPVRPPSAAPTAARALPAPTACWSTGTHTHRRALLHLRPVRQGLHPLLQAAVPPAGTHQDRLFSRPFGCSDCGKNFNTAYDLKAHRRFESRLRVHRRRGRKINILPYLISIGIEQGNERVFGCDNWQLLLDQVQKRFVGTGKMSTVGPEYSPT
ncbi:uncharacterized protein LOC129716056 [Leucoraja erinacea]|uniref:uncharacterized protein LOC129716056 n=1 Tax=Leucoraja erinaceus TaxID=7782 RepID=UPI00245470ED|nr:uncharacterized protein LOC129716056 [Leucoraja erinacea]